MGKTLTSILFGLSLMTSIITSCTPSGSAGYVRRTTSAANDHIMVVRQEPQTFGHKRLTALSNLYPDLRTFLNQNEFPDFLAETNKGENRYLILYYLDSRKAFACRSETGRSRQIEFSGPYPVTDREAKTLRDLRTKAEKAS